MYYKLKILPWVAFFLWTPWLLLAQEKQPDFTRQFYEIHTYTTKDGLSQVSINDIVQDEEGFLWIATQNGLNRFDGTSFNTFSSEYQSEKYGSYINTLVADHEKIWIGTRAAGLCYFDKTAYRFYSIQPLQNFNIEDMVMDGHGHLFVTLENKGVGFISSDTTVYTFHFINYFPGKNITATSLFIDHDKTLWVGTKEGRLFYGSITRNPDKIAFQEYLLPDNPGKIFTMSSRNSSQLWLGTQNKLYLINIKTGQQEVVNYSRKDASSVIYDLKWQNDILWVGTGAGLFGYDAQNHKVLNRYLHSEKDPGSISNNVVYTVFPDQYGQLWIGTGKYLNLFYRNETFNKIQNRSNDQNSLNSNIIFSILKNKQDLWVGTSGGGINLLRNQKRFTFTKKTHNLPSNICFSLLADDNNIWAGTKEGLVVIKNGNADYNAMNVQTVFHNPQNNHSLGNNFIRYLYKDSGNNIWLCTSGSGLDRFTGNLAKNRFRFAHYKYQPGQTGSIASDKVNYLLETGKNKYWVATDKGLNILSFDDDHFQKARFSRLRKGDSILLDKTVIYTLLKDKAGGMWIGTTNGLYYWYNHQLKLFNKDNGLPDNVIYAILEDFSGNIWLSTNKGISRYNVQAGKFTHFHQSDGLSSEEYDLHAKFIDSNGILYFGGIDGITWFNPETLKTLQPGSKLFIDKVLVTNPKNNSLETLHPANGQSISLHRNQLPITVKFSDINLRFYKTQIFNYRLLPDNTRWNTLTNSKSIQLLNLSPGNYSLEIQADVKGKVNNKENILHVPISILPYWWQSKPAYFAYLLIIVLVIYLIFRFSLKRKIEHQENLRLKEVNHLKSQLYANITHEFRTPLTVIKGMTDTIRGKLNPDEKKQCHDDLAMIERNSDKLLYLIKQMLDMSKIEAGSMKPEFIQDNIISYLQYVLESFQSMADVKNIKLVFYHETDKIVMDYDQDKIFIIASNLLTNAIKFTPEGGKIIFHVKRENHHDADNLIIKVQDSGIGIDEQHLANIFDRFYQIDNSQTRKGEGTGIGLALVKEMVNLLNGEITVDSTPGERTEFCVILPITNKASLVKAKQEKTRQIDTTRVKSDVSTQSIGNKNLPLALVIEDNPDVAKYLISSLRGNYQVRWSPDGQQGIDAAIEFIPDIIISDVMMPEKDGFEVCEALKVDERTSHIPIILLTAKATVNDRIEGLSHGADAYLTKPFNKKELFVRLEQLIKIRKQLQEKYSKVELSIAEKSKPEGEERFLKKVIGLIEQQLDNSELDPVMLASQLNMSKSQLYRKLKAVSGKSIAVYIRSIRLLSAKNMLETTGKNISEIAFLCGFNDPSWFSRIFKKEFGVSPGTFRK